MSDKTIPELDHLDALSGSEKFVAHNGTKTGYTLASEVATLSAGVVATYANQALTSANSASIAAAAASTSSTNAATSATNAASSEIASANSATAAQIAANNAIASTLTYTTLAALNADLAHGANTVATVYGDGANDGDYLKSGASGAGSWSYLRPSVSQTLVAQAAIAEYRADLTDPDFVYSIGHAPVTGSNASAGTYIFGGAAIPSGYVKQFQIFAGANATVKLKRFTRNADTFTMAAEYSLSVATGVLNTFSLAAGTLPYIAVNEGDFLAIQSATANFVKTNSAAAQGTEYYYDASDVTTTLVLAFSALPTAGTRVECYFEVANDPNELDAYVRGARNSWGTTLSLGVTTPASSSQTAATKTFFIDQTFQNDSLITAIACYTRLATTIIFYVLRPASGGFTVDRIFSARTAIGSNSLVAGTNFPAGVRVPAGGMIGFRALTASALDADVFETRDYLTVNGSPITSTTVTFDGTANSQAHQIRFDFAQQISRKAIADRYDGIFRQSFASVIPTTFNSTNWSIVSGAAQNSANGLANQLAYKRGTYGNARGTLVFSFTGGSDEIAVFRDASGLGLGSLGTVATLNRSTGLLAFRGAWGGGSTLPSVQSSKTTSLTLATNRKYRIDFTKNYRIITITVTDLITGASDSLSKTDLTTAAGFMQGKFGVAATAGTLNVYSMDFVPSVRDPLVLILGDSIAEGFSSTTNTGGWAQQVATACRGMVSAHSGETSANILQRLNTELLQHNFRYVIVLIGTNDTNTTTWQNNVTYIQQRIALAGSTPVFCTVLPEAADSNPELVMNPFLRASGWRLIEFDRAITTGGTGLGADLNASLKADTLHPNDAGHAALFARVQIDLPELFDLAV